MNKTFAALAVSVALVSIGASAVPALAGDMNTDGGSAKGRGAQGIAVPAPVPYEEHYKYYMGAGAGFAFMSSGNIGLTVGGIPVGSAPTFGDADDFRGPFSVSLFAGRYITPSLRMELGVDLRSEQKRSKTSRYQSELRSTHDFGAAPGPGYLPVTNTYDVNRTDSVEIRNNTFMINAYYDMNRGGRFNPYVGAGIGLAQMQFQSRSTENVTGCASTDPTAADPTLATPCWSGTAPYVMPSAGLGMAHRGSQTGYGLAAALMAGFTYDLSARTHLDVGYRLMYQGGKAVTSGPSLGYCNGGCLTGVSSLSVDTRVDHEIRTGIRWDLW